MEKNLHLLQKKIKIKFKDPKILLKALTHKSYDPINNNEKMEFLGDRVLGLVIAKKLLEIYPNEKEGILDKKFASLVNKKTCLLIANNIGIDRFIMILKSTKNKSKIEDKVLSDACEALIGAIYLDKGLKIAENFILTLWKNEIDKSVVTKIDAKTKLQEYSLKIFKKLPIYKLISNTGPRHQPIIKVSVKLFDGKIYYGEGKSKKNAEQNAASLCLNNLK
mgnify:FL=1